MSAHNPTVTSQIWYLSHRLRWTIIIISLQYVNIAILILTSNAPCDWLLIPVAQSDYFLSHTLIYGLNASRIGLGRPITPL